MEFWEDNKLAITGCVATMLVLLLVYVFLLGPIGHSVTVLADKNREWDEKLEEYYPKGGMSTDLLISEFEASNARLRKRFDILSDKMTARIEESFVVPLDEPQPGFFFRRLLTKKRQALMFYASTHGMDSIDETLGFGENVPEDEAVAGMLSDLASACEIVRIAADAGVRVIDDIKHIGVSEKGGPGLSPFIKERGLRMAIKCDLSALIKFLRGLDEKQLFFGLKDVKIESPGLGKQKLLEVEVVCATFSFFKPVQPVLQEGGPAARGPAPTYGL